MRVINGIRYLPGGLERRDPVGRRLNLVIDGLRYGVLNQARQRTR